MSDELRRDTVGELFMNVMQHMKCIEIRLECAKAATSQKQKYALQQSIIKVRAAIDTLCGLLGDAAMVADVKKSLDKVDLVYVMLLTEQLFTLPNEDLDEVTDMIEKHINEKYAERTE